MFFVRLSEVLLVDCFHVMMIRHVKVFLNRMMCQHTQSKIKDVNLMYSRGRGPSGGDQVRGQGSEPRTCCSCRDDESESSDVMTVC